MLWPINGAAVTEKFVELKAYTIPENPLSRAMRGRDGVAVAQGFELRCLPIHQRERIRNMSGHRVKQEIWDKGEAQKEQLEAITLTIVERLKRCLDMTKGYMGVDLYRPASDGTLHVICSVDDEAEELLAVKHQVILPSVARMERASLLKEWAKLTETIRHNRLYVITSGERCYGHQVRKRFRDLHVKLAEFRRLLKKKPEFRGIEVLLRTDETTIKRDADGNATYHPHMNLAIHFPYALGEKLFAKWLQLMHCHFGTHLQDCGEIRDPRELIKYVTKFESDKKDGTIGILDLTDVELASFYHIRAGMKPVQALGAFRQFRRELRENRKKIVTDRDINGVCRLVIVPKPPIKPQRPSQSDDPGVNIFVALTEPSPRYSPTIRPSIVIRNFNGDFTACRKNLNLYSLRNFVLEAEKANACRQFPESGSNVHTFTETLDESWEDALPKVVTQCGKPDLLWTPGTNRGKEPPG